MTIASVKIELDASDLLLIREAIGFQPLSVYGEPESAVVILRRIRTLAKEVVRLSTGKSRHDPNWQFVIQIQDGRDLCGIASPIIGAVYSCAADAADRINFGTLSRGFFGKVRVRSTLAAEDV